MDLAGRFDPPVRLFATAMPVDAHRDETGRWTAEDDHGAAIYLHPEHGWLPVVDDGEPLGPIEMVPTCPACGCQEFSYEEGCSQYWPHGQSLGDADGGVIWLDTIGWDGIGESGDGDPGLFCDHYRGGGCGAPIDLPDGWEVDYR